jgi:HEAT repeat protein
MKKPILTFAALALVIGASAPAIAGKGGSAARIQNAVASGSEDAIIAEIERAERLVCPACVEPVMELLDHPSYAVRDAAAWWIARRPAQRREVAELAYARLQMDDSVLARNAADILGAFRHPEAIPALAQAAQSSTLSAEARTHAVRAIGDIGHDRGNEILAAAMVDGSSDVRYQAVRSWRSIRWQAQAEPVAALVDDDDVRVRREAASVVGAMREGAARAALERQVVSDPDPAVRRNAAWALGRIGDPASRDALRAATSDASPLVRRTAEVALRELR